MATSTKKKFSPSQGTVAIHTGESDILGVGSYGKVCKAKCGQLLCAAKLLHDTLLDTCDPGLQSFVEKFEQECDFLKAIKHPNVVQFLGTAKDPQTGKLALLMELMDESLTRFLERSTGPLPYHTQLNICQDVALALAYLHSNDIIHRDLSSNNVLLIGEGIRAKVTDFGMSKIKSKYRLTPLTMCPGTQAYMPPEALITPPQYSSKLDCFSHGVLTIQIVTRQFPSPGDAHVHRKIGTVKQVPETERRKKDIDLVPPDHPLLPLALHCLKGKETKRPSADELCGILAILKCEPKYTDSVELSRDHRESLQELQQKLHDTVANFNVELKAKKVAHEKHLSEKDSVIKQLCEDNRQLLLKQEQLRKEIDDLFQMMLRGQKKDSPIEQLHSELKKLKQKQEHLPQESQLASTRISMGESDTPKMTWRQEKDVPFVTAASLGAATVHSNTAYFSEQYRIHSYTCTLPPKNRWKSLPLCACKLFSLVVVNGKLTTIGGSRQARTPIKEVHCMDLELEEKWEQLPILPPMPTARLRPAAVTTPTHLVVAGGETDRFGYPLPKAGVILILDLKTPQWFSIKCLPKLLRYPHLTFCGESLYLSEDSTIFSCSVEELLTSGEPPSTNSSDVWTRLTDIPVSNNASLATLMGQVLAIEGTGTSTGAIHCYNRSTNSWSIIGEMPTPRSDTLVAILPSNELIVVGGKREKKSCKVIEIAQISD